MSRRVLVAVLYVDGNYQGAEKTDLSFARGRPGMGRFRIKP